MMRHMLQGKTISFTGDLGAMTRKQAAAAAKALGATVSTSVTHGTDILVAGEGATAAKQAKAQANGVTLLTAPQFLQSIAGGLPQPQQPRPPAVAATPSSSKSSVPNSQGPIEYPPEALAHQAALVAARQKAGLSAYDAQFDEDFDEDMNDDEVEAENTHTAATANPEEPQPTFIVGAVNLTDKTVAVTGSLGSCTRAEAISRLQQVGAHYMASVSGNTDYLLCGVNATEGKILEAHRKGVSLITEGQFTAATNISASRQEPHKAAHAPFSHQHTTATTPNTTVVSLQGKSISITGTLANYSRSEAIEYAKRAGAASVHSNVSSSTDYLICGAQPTAHKVASAHQCGVMILAEHQFTAAIATPAAVHPSVAVAPAMQQQQQQQVQSYAEADGVLAPIDENNLDFTEEPISLPGKVIAITGTLDGFTRADASAQAKQAGATVSSAVTHQTDYLVCGFSPTASKVAAAEANGVDLVSEEQFAEALSTMAPISTPGAPRVPAATAPTPATGVLAQGARVSLAGKTIVFTGTMSVNRLVAAVMATKSGATIATTLNGKTDYVVCGSNAGAKMAQAQSLGMTLLTESQFVASCRQ